MFGPVRTRAILVTRLHAPALVLHHQPRAPSLGCVIAPYLARRIHTALAFASTLNATITIGPGQNQHIFAACTS